MFQILRLISFLSLAMFIMTCAGNKNGFIRDLPSEALLNQVSEADFSGEDAIIILKELSYKVGPATVFVGGFAFDGISSTETTVKIVSLLSDKGVDEFGTYEFEYSEPWGNLKSGFEAKVRVLKPDGSIEVMAPELVKVEIALEDENGDVLRRKVIFKIPNLSVGDILQQETVFTKPFSYSTGKMFFMNEDYNILFENLYITLPQDYEAS